MRRILLTRPMPERVVEAARTNFDVEIRYDPVPMKTGQMRAALALYDGVMPTLGDMFTAEVFDGFENPRCKILANFGVGYNHIDAKAARAVGVSITNTPGAVTNATADIALTLMLMSARRAGEGERLVRAGAWEGWTPTQMLGLHMTGKTVGIIGMGRIGQAVARRCHYGFDMKVLYANRSEKNLEFPARHLHMLEVLAGADFVVLCVPATSETHHLMNAETISQMAPHARLINVARGDVVDEPALIAALQRGQIGGAGLDVYEHEPEIPEEMMALENVVLLPHLGTAALQVREAMGLMAVENLRAFLAGDTPPNLVN
ncbi:D-glycerate dehydrogenase [uncultured Roseovarius sp.]|uniref:2-hydroxyacid dehydrogenase n=1 Tax=uncultured Roseovarius sp. TaxID=293344 RepID=UPI00260D5C25|nr:D-glycerate dehydrogenase [uncultured Roseovarius sp.]